MPFFAHCKNNFDKMLAFKSIQLDVYLHFYIRKALCITYSSPNCHTLLFQNTKLLNFLILSQSHFTEKDDSVKKQLRISLSRQFGVQELSH